MSTEVILLIIAVVLALPGGLFVAGLSSMARAKWAALFGGLVGGVVVALAILFYVNTANVSIDGLSYFYGVFFAASIGVFTRRAGGELPCGSGQSPFPRHACRTLAIPQPQRSRDTRKPLATAGSQGLCSCAAAWLYHLGACFTLAPMWMLPGSGQGCQPGL